MEYRAMTRSRTTITILAVFAVILSTASLLWAESGVGDPDDLFPICGTSATAVPPACVDPNAKGTKLTGTLTIAYDGEPAPAGGCDIFLVNNQFVVLTVGFNNQIQPFNTDFEATGTSPMCFEQNTQLQYVITFIGNEVIPTLFNCAIGSCPSWVFKSVNLLTSGKVSEGAVYAEVTIAVK